VDILAAMGEDDQWSSGMPSARLKMARAMEHAERLNAEILAFRDEYPYEYETRSLGNASGSPDIRIIAKIVEAPPVPESWSLITGDFLTNARAALDHAVFRHVRQQAPQVPEHRIQYPIFDTPEKFESDAADRFAGDVLRVVEDSQPYLADDPNGHALRLLRDLVNIDKHRTLLVTNYSTDRFDVDYPAELVELVESRVFEVPMVVGATVGRAHLRLRRDVDGEQLYQFPCNVSYGETIIAPGFDKPVGLLQAVDCIRLALPPHLDNLEAAGC
jgi:hypothetical protein